MAKTIRRLIEPPPDAEPPPEPQTAQQELPFDEQLYLTMNPDVADAVRSGGVVSAEAHWLAFGRFEEQAGERPSIFSEQHYSPASRVPPGPDDKPTSFDAIEYLGVNHDVGAALAGTLEAAMSHWYEHGRAEGRALSRWGHRRPPRKDPARAAAKPWGVNFYAPFGARSGLGTAARGYLAALRDAGIPVHLVNIHHDSRHFRVTDQDRGRPAPYRVNLVQMNADSLAGFFGLFPADHFDDAYTIAVWAWELNTLRPDWFGSFDGLDEVWTLSRFNTAAVAPMAPVPVHTVNCVVAPPIGTGFDRAHFSLPEGFLFLTAFDVGSSIRRKNPEAVVAAFRTAFAGRTDVHLVLKFHAGHVDPATLQALLRDVRDLPNVIIRSQTLTDAEMLGLQACCDCLVSAHRSEGFGLNIAEFMHLGRPVIVTGHSGNMDYTTDENSYLIPCRMVQIEEASGPYLPGYQWAEPDVDRLAELMGRVVAAPEEARGKGQLAAEFVRSRLSAQAVGARIQERFTALGLCQDLPPYAQVMLRERRARMPAPEAIEPLATAAAAQARPTLSVIVPVHDVPGEYLERCIASVLAQTYTRWELCLCDDASKRPDTLEVLARHKGSDPRIRVRRLEANLGIAGASNEAVSMATGTYLVMLDNDDELTPEALHEIARAVVADPSIDALYSDEDKYDGEGRLCDHYHKPDWSPEHLESVMYTLHPLTVRTSLFLRLGGFRAAFSGAQDWDLMLRVSRITQAIHHIPRILYHWRMIEGSAAATVDAKPDALLAGQRALQDHVAAKYGDAAEVAPSGLAGHHRVRHAILGEPAVTLLIFTDNRTIELPGRKPFVMVENLVTSIHAHTDYRNIKIVVVDNGNTGPRLRAFYKKCGVELHSYASAAPTFNFADKANFAFRAVRTPHVVMMNDDMEAIDDGWLRALLEFSQQPEVGACGGKLLHADGSIQHVGTVLGVNGGSAHVYHGFPGDFVGYNGYTHVCRNYSALTGACLAMRMEVVNELGGFDPAFAIDFNDVDFCLRLRRHGYRLVYTPYSRMVHFESKTAIRTAQNPAELSLFRARWGDIIKNDPFYNPNLSRHRHDFAAAS